jgi:hypothetical protein
MRPHVRRRFLVHTVAFLVLVLSGMLFRPAPAFAGGVVGSGTPASCTEPALDAALGGGGTITFNCGADPATIVVTSPKVIASNTTIDGGNLISISGGGMTRVFDVQAGASLTLANLTIRDAYFVDGAGGGVRNAGALIIDHSSFINNCALGGGGIYSYGTALTVSDSTFTGNNANTQDCPGNPGATIPGRGDGGAISVNHNNSALVSITNTTFESNTAYAGGGLALSGTSHVAVSDSTFNANVANNSGGGIESSGVLTVTASTFVKNTSGFIGGGLTQNGSTLTVSKSTFTSNNAHSNGGALMNAGGNTTVADTILTNNVSDFGGGINNTFGPLTLINSTLSGNSASSFGGGINNTNVVSVANSTFSSNTSKNGGGIYTYGGELRIAGATFADNTASVAGGGLHFLGGTQVITNSTISGNSAPGGGGMENAGTLTLMSSTVAANSGAGIANDDVNGGVSRLEDVLVGNNAGQDCSGTIMSEGHNLDSDGTCGLNQPGDMSHVDPRIGPLQDNGGPTHTHAPLIGSPAIDRGADCPATDQRGVTRPQGHACDIGAVEFNGPVYQISLPLMLR